MKGPGIQPAPAFVGMGPGFFSWKRFFAPDRHRANSTFRTFLFVQTLPLKSAKKIPGTPRVLPGVVTVTRQVHFNAAHRLFNPGKSRQWNVEHYGLCSNPNWHGHNYVLEVSVRGTPDPRTGYLIDLGELKRILHSAVVDPCDHRNLNQEVPFLRGIIPTTENLVTAFWNELAPRLKPARLACVRRFETPRNFTEYHGPLAG
jgi:6-pyruvoyltetrahydropterin/6-carboxytetrahydropterin synthase